MYAHKLNMYKFIHPDYGKFTFSNSNATRSPLRTMSNIDGITSSSAAVAALFTDSSTFPTNGVDDFELPIVELVRFEGND